MVNISCQWDWLWSLLSHRLLSRTMDFFPGRITDGRPPEVGSSFHYPKCQSMYLLPAYLHALLVGTSIPLLPYFAYVGRQLLWPSSMGWRPEAFQESSWLLVLRWDCWSIKPYGMISYRVLSITSVQLLLDYPVCIM